jgi:hypothetical protein
MKKSYLEVIKYPLALWLAFQAVAFVFGFTNYMNLSIELLLSEGTIFMAILFGVWVGRRSSKAFKYLWVSMLNALMLSIIVGFVTLLFVYLLSVYSQGFISYMSQYGPSSSLTTIALDISVVAWIQMVFFAIVSAALAYEFSSK